MRLERSTAALRLALLGILVSRLTTGTRNACEGRGWMLERGQAGCVVDDTIVLFLAVTASMPNISLVALRHQQT